MQMVNARGAARLRTIKSGQVIIEPEDAKVDCAIRNMSVSGVLIRLDENVDMPKVVELVIVSHDIRVRAHVAWQKGKEAGLEFEPGAIKAV